MSNDDNNCPCQDLSCWPFLRRRRRNNSNNNALVVVAPAVAAAASRHRHGNNSSISAEPPPPPPRFISIRRESSPLLTACWRQDWEQVASYLDTVEDTNATTTTANTDASMMIYHRSAETGRTALHLATIPGARATPALLRRLLQANPYAVATEDYHQYGGTPLHFACGSKLLRNQPTAVILPFCETIKALQAQYPQCCTVRVSYWSPLYQAAKYAAPPATLWILVRTAATTTTTTTAHADCTPTLINGNDIATSIRPLTWIAPWTGAESWQKEAEIRRTSLEPARDSPLRSLWRRCTSTKPAGPRFVSIHGLPLEDMKQLTVQFYEAVASTTSTTTTDDTDVMEFFAKRLATIGDEEEGHDDFVLNNWCKILVLLQSQSPTVQDLLGTAVSMHASIPPLVRLLTVLWPEQLLSFVSSDYTDNKDPESSSSSLSPRKKKKEVLLLPIHLAMDRYAAAEFPKQRIGAKEVLEILVQAQPAALTVPHPRTGFPPAIQAATLVHYRNIVGQSSAALSLLPDVDLIYTLLRPVPTLVPASKP